MSILEFKNMLINNLEHELGSGVEISGITMRKNNGVMREGVSIKRKGMEIAPSIYIDDLYEQFKQGVSIRHLTRLVLLQYGSLNEDKVLAASFEENYEKISEHVYCKLINYKMNEEFLKEVPYQRWQDLAAVFYYQPDCMELEDMAVMIRNEFLDIWSVPASRVASDAWYNSVSKYPPVFRRLTDVIDEMMYEEVGEEMPGFGTMLMEEENYRKEEPTPLYLLTNSKRCMGSICICYPGELDLLSDALGGSFFILPSSIHECLILPDDSSAGKDVFDQMVREINKDQVLPEEVLADHAYYYSAVDRSIHV
ncbi:MAG: DUF5688 family protein [Eubacterium sp.]|nr:DUF5688 family protein [Eubacterium sp.]